MGPVSGVHSSANSRRLPLKVAGRPKNVLHSSTGAFKGKAADYYTTLVHREPAPQFYDLARQMKERFDRQLQPEFAHVEFTGARQGPTESLL